MIADPFVDIKKIGKVRRSFFKCYGCRKEWSIRKDSMASRLKSFTLLNLFWLLNSLS